MTQYRYSLAYNLNYCAKDFVSVFLVRINMKDIDIHSIFFSIDIVKNRYTAMNQKLYTEF